MRAAQHAKRHDIISETAPSVKHNQAGSPSSDRTASEGLP